MSPPKFHDIDHERSRISREINGHRPSPLKISKESHVIHKSYSSSSNSSSYSTSASALAFQQQQQRRPVIIYAHSPKVIHTQARDFMALVQKLTGRHENTAPTQKQAAENLAIMKKQKPVVCHDHDNDSSSVLTDEKLVVSSGGAAGVNLSSFSPITKPPTNPFLADIPLFTPTGTDFFCSPRPMYRFPESMYASPNTGYPISPSVFEFMKGLPEY